MKVCVLVNDLGLSGGVGVVLEHAHNLAAHHGFEVTLALTRDVEQTWRYPRLSALRVRTVEEAAREHHDIAVATWWRTTVSLFEIPADRYAYFVQSLEDRFYQPGDVERLEAAITHDLPVAFITEARWIADTLNALHPAAPCYYVRNGISKAAFPPVERVVPALDGPLRVLVEGHPDVWFKGVPEAAEAIARMREPHEATFVSPSGSAGGLEGFDRVVGPLTHAELAAEYRAHHAVLKMSRVEGMYGPPLEGFHCGATVVTTPVTGFDEYVEHGWNGLVADWDDLRGTARALDLLAKDRRYLHFLRSNALATARGWPSWEQASDMMASVLYAIRRRPAPAAAPAAGRALADLSAASAELRRDHDRLRQYARDLDGSLTNARKDVEHLLGEVDRLRTELLAKGDELAEHLRHPIWQLGNDLYPLQRYAAFRQARRALLIWRRRVKPAARRMRLLR